MKDYQKISEAKSLTGKPRVSFAIPEAMSKPSTGCASGNTVPKNIALRLTGPNQMPHAANEKLYNKSLARNVDSTETRKTAFRKHASFPARQCSVQKQYVRDSALPVSKLNPSHCSAMSVSGQGILKKNLTSKDFSSTECRCNQSSCQSKCTKHRSECDSPELLSSLSIAKKIQSTTAALKEPRANIYSLNPLVEQEIEERAANRLNFPLDELVYRNLVTLNIRDDELAGSTREKCKCSKEFESSHLKDEEPVLSDFYQPRYGEEYSSVVHPVPASIDKVRRFNGLAIYNKMHFWVNHSCETNGK